VSDGQRLISFVIPCYQSAGTIGAVAAEIRAAMAAEPGYAYEILLINDDPSAGAFEALRRLCDQDQRVRAVDLARNFGQHAAVMAGLRRARGDMVICLDDDGQTPADEAMKLIRALEAGADVAFAAYRHKRHSALRNLGSALNERMARYLLGKPKELQLNSYFAARRFVVEEICRYEGAYPYIDGLILRATASVVNVPVAHRSRASGRSGYTFMKLLALWFNGFTAFSVKPLRAATFAGLLFAAMGFCFGLFVLIRQMFEPSEILGWASTMVALLFIGGLILASLGMSGEYLGRLYINVNRAPQYVVRREVPPRDDREAQA
jgi:undecaprenyl-phosphate 4-deoxy-4-formamido-L-arabinose transferase